MVIVEIHPHPERHEKGDAIRVTGNGELIVQSGGPSSDVAIAIYAAGKWFSARVE